MTLSPEQKREYQRRWMAKRRSDWFASNGPCAGCGSWDDLELDHADRSTKVSHRVWSWSKSRRDVELAKCQVLCQPCHRSKSNDELATKQHGTPAMYQKHGCRCSACREWKRLSDKKYRGR